MASRRPVTGDRPVPGDCRCRRRSDGVGVDPYEVGSAPVGRRQRARPPDARGGYPPATGRRPAPDGLLPIVEKAIAAAVRVVLRADDSSGIIGGAIRDPLCAVGVLAA